MISSQRRWFGSFAAVLALFPTSLGAQTVAQSFDELQQILNVGQTVIVTDERGSETRGKVVELSSSSLTVQRPGPLGGRYPFPAERVASIARVDSNWNGLVIGLAAGAVPGAYLGWGVNTYCYNETPSEYAGRCPIWGFSLGALVSAAGAWIGWEIDDAIKKRTLVFGAASSKRSVAISPLLGTDRQGVQVLVRF